MATRLYFHAANNPASNLPTTEQSALTIDDNADAQTVNRLMDRTIGSSGTSISNTSLTTTALRNYYFTRFISNPIDQTSIAANTWIYNFGTATTGNSANFPVSGSNQPVYVNCYVWRAGSGKVYTVYEGNSASTCTEGGVGVIFSQHTTFSGSSGTIQSGDFLCLEIIFQITQATTTSFSQGFYFDGTTITNNSGSTISGPASYLQTPEDLVFVGDAPAFIDMTNSSTKTIADKYITKV